MAQKRVYSLSAQNFIETEENNDPVSEVNSFISTKSEKTKENKYFIVKSNDSTKTSLKRKTTLVNQQKSKVSIEKSKKLTKKQPDILEIAFQNCFTDNPQQSTTSNDNKSKHQLQKEDISIELEFDDDSSKDSDKSETNQSSSNSQTELYLSMPDLDMAPHEPTPPLSGSESTTNKSPANNISSKESEIIANAREIVISNEPIEEDNCVDFEPSPPQSSTSESNTINKSPTAIQDETSQNNDPQIIEVRSLNTQNQKERLRMKSASNDEENETNPNSDNQNETTEQQEPLESENQPQLPLDDKESPSQNKKLVVIPQNSDQQSEEIQETTITTTPPPEDENIAIDESNTNVKSDENTNNIDKQQSTSADNTTLDDSKCIVISNTDTVHNVPEFFHDETSELTNEQQPSNNETAVEPMDQLQSTENQLVQPSTDQESDRIAESEQLTTTVDANTTATNEIALNVDSSQQFEVSINDGGDNVETAQLVLQNDSDPNNTGFLQFDPSQVETVAVNKDDIQTQYVEAPIEFQENQIVEIPMSVFQNQLQNSDTLFINSDGTLTATPTDKTVTSAPVIEQSLTSDGGVEQVIHSNLVVEQDVPNTETESIHSSQKQDVTNEQQTTVQSDQVQINPRNSIDEATLMIAEDEAMEVDCQQTPALLTQSNLQKHQEQFASFVPIDENTMQKDNESCSSTDTFSKVRRKLFGKRGGHSNKKKNSKQPKPQPQPQQQQSYPYFYKYPPYVYELPQKPLCFPKKISVLIIDILKNKDLCDELKEHQAKLSQIVIQNHDAFEYERNVNKETISFRESMNLLHIADDGSSPIFEKLSKFDDADSDNESNNHSESDEEDASFINPYAIVSEEISSACEVSKGLSMVPLSTPHKFPNNSADSEENLAKKDKLYKKKDVISTTPSPNVQGLFSLTENINSKVCDLDKKERNKKLPPDPEEKLIKPTLGYERKQISKIVPKTIKFSSHSTLSTHGINYKPIKLDTVTIEQNINEQCIEDQVNDIFHTRFIHFVKNKKDIVRFKDDSDTVPRIIKPKINSTKIMSKPEGSQKSIKKESIIQKQIEKQVKNRKRLKNNKSNIIQSSKKLNDMKISSSVPVVKLKKITNKEVIKSFNDEHNLNDDNYEDDIVDDDDDSVYNPNLDSSIESDNDNGVVDSYLDQDLIIGSSTRKRKVKVQLNKSKSEDKDAGEMYEIKNIEKIMKGKNMNEEKKYFLLRKDSFETSLKKKNEENSVGFHCYWCRRVFSSRNGLKTHLCIDKLCSMDHDHTFVQQRFESMAGVNQWLKSKNYDKEFSFRTTRSTLTRLQCPYGRCEKRSTVLARKKNNIVACNAGFVVAEADFCLCDDNSSDIVCSNFTNVFLAHGCVQHNHENTNGKLPTNEKERIASYIGLGLSNTDIVDIYTTEEPTQSQNGINELTINQIRRESQSAIQNVRSKKQKSIDLLKQMIGKLQMPSKDIDEAEKVMNFLDCYSKDDSEDNSLISPKKRSLSNGDEDENQPLSKSSRFS